MFAHKLGIRRIGNPGRPNPENPDGPNLDVIEAITFFEDACNFGVSPDVLEANHLAYMPIDWVRKFFIWSAINITHGDHPHNQRAVVNGIANDFVSFESC